MKTKEPDESFLKVIFIDIYKYNEILLKIHINDQVLTRTCVLFKLPINEDFDYPVEVMNFIDMSLEKNSEYKIQILKDRRRNKNENRELVTLYSKDLSINFNDVILTHIKELIEQQRFRTMISSIKKRKKV